MDWFDGLTRARVAGTPGVLATIVEGRGHSPRDAGAKMFIDAATTSGSIGDGNMEATLIQRARAMLHDGPDTVLEGEFGLNEHARFQYGTQCCGGIVWVLLELIGQRPTVAIFGAGHVGKELAHILSPNEIILHLADSREGMIDDVLGATLNTGPATVHVHTLPAPETLIAELPDGAHILILTHDHAEDLMLCDTALRREGVGSIGVIGAPISPENIPSSSPSASRPTSCGSCRRLIRKQGGFTGHRRFNFDVGTSQAHSIPKWP